jgi:hypothetical protein
VHVIDGTSEDPAGDLKAVNDELELFSPWLARKPQVRARVRGWGEPTLTPT